MKCGANLSQHGSQFMWKTPLLRGNSGMVESQLGACDESGCSDLTWWIAVGHEESVAP